jgi:hypothetical protein
MSELSSCFVIKGQEIYSKNNNVINLSKRNIIFPPILLGV